MTERLQQSRILIYSHDSFGLGHLRRCRSIAHSLVAHYKGLSVLILSGSPIIGSFDFKARVDFVRIPGVIKLKDGEYTSLGLHIDLDAVDSVTMEYGGGITTLVGCGTICTPGSLAAIERAWQRFGSMDWKSIFAPAIRACREGFPLSSACHYYLGYSGKPIFGRSDDGFNALHENGALRDSSASIIVPHLADSLSLIAEEGVTFACMAPAVLSAIRIGGVK